MPTLLDEVRAAKRLPPHTVAAEIRRAAGVTQERLAQELGVHVSTVIRWEAGVRHPRGTLRARYAEVLRAIQEEMSA